MNSAHSATLEPEARYTAAPWNETAFKSYLFDAISLMLPSVEKFIVGVVEQAMPQLDQSPELKAEVTQFLREENSHARAHRLYNQRLQDQGYDAQALEKKLSDALQSMQSRWHHHDLLCVVAAGEHITTVISRAVLRSARWVTARHSPQAQLWRWHCEEEVAHCHVAMALLVALNVPYWRRIRAYFLTLLFLGMDVTRHVSSLYATDAARGRITAWRLTRSAANFGLSIWPDWLKFAGGLVQYFVPIQTAVGAGSETQSPAVSVRFLTQADIRALLVLEAKKWETDQAASEQDLRDRIDRHPQLCIGAFSAETGEALASLFMKPTSVQALQNCNSWRDCVNGVESHEQPDNALFGISLSSVHKDALKQIFEFFWPYALKSGWCDIYLGSPIPGLKKWRATHPDQPVEKYVQAKRGHLPLDPQLRYYHGRGFRKIVRTMPSYFQHQNSLDYGVLIQGHVPLSGWSWLWKRLPLKTLQCFRRVLFRIL